MSVQSGAEQRRLASADKQRREWKKWGPYVSERQWGTVREDYSPHGTAWDYFPFEMARVRSYRWGEDGIAGICDEMQHLCFSVAMWNGQDSIIKERFYGLSGNEGNHGEDVKELYYYLDNTPTHSYMKMLYKYPQAAFPYELLKAENAKRGVLDPEIELVDTGVFTEGRYFDVFIEYAKANPEDILIRLTVFNRGTDAAELHLLPQLWFRNTWSWNSSAPRPLLNDAGRGVVEARHHELGTFWLYAEEPEQLLFCDNDTNAPLLYGMPESSGCYYKDGIDAYLVQKKASAVNHAGRGTKVAAHFPATIYPNVPYTVRLRLSNAELKHPFIHFDKRFDKASEEADEFYGQLQAGIADEDAKQVQRQAYAGLLWTKQFYNFEVDRWLKGDPGQPPPPPERVHGRMVYRRRFLLYQVRVNSILVITTA